MNYQELSGAVKNWLQNAAVTGNEVEIIDVAEGHIKNDVVARSIEKQLVGNMTQPVIWLPGDLHVLQRVVAYRNTSEHSVLYQAPSSAERVTGSVGFPEAYNLLDQSLILYPTPDSAYRYILYYIPVVQPLATMDGGTNWLIERSPNLYLFATLKEAATFVKDWDSAARYEQKYQSALMGLLAADNRTRFPLSSPLTIRARAL